MNIQDLPTAKLRPLAEAGQVDACFELANRYETGTLVLPQDITQANYWKNKAEQILNSNPLNVSYANFNKLNSEEKFTDALIVLEKSRTNGLLSDNYYYHLMKGRLMCKIACIEGKSDEACFKTIDKEIRKALETIPQESMDFGYYWLARNYQQYADFYNARKYYIKALNVPDDILRDDSQERLLELEKNELAEVWENYVNKYEYKDRKFLMPITDKEIAECVVDGIETFRVSNIPSCIKFPMGHPIANELYIGHPYNPELYVPYSQSEDIFFLDKIHELSYLLECLGAEEITMTSIKGRNVSEYANHDKTITVGVNVGTVETEVNMGKKGNTERNSVSNASRTLTMKFDPMQKPFLPEGLIWYKEQPQWQRLVNSRLNGNMLEYNEFVSTTETKFVSESEQTDIKASAQYLWNKVEGDVNRKLESQFKENVETQWKIEVKFRSVKDFELIEDSTNSSKAIISLYTRAEQEYLDILNECLKDDAEITPRERKMLDRIRQSLGISEERAKELEVSLQPQLTGDEQEYLEMYREYAEKGDITEKERRRLDKFANALGLTNERVKEIETF